MQKDLFGFGENSVNLNDGDIRIIELFAGVGGFRIGFEKASNRFKTIWSNQWEPSTKRQDASMIYGRCFGLEGHINEDIAKIPTSAIPDADLLCGGFPCQDYSVATTLANSKGIEGKKGVLWWQIQRILKEKGNNAPRYLVLENVDRLLSSPANQRGRDFAIILASLSDLGYIIEWRIINAAEYGMPQKRKRIYMLAYRETSFTAKAWEHNNAPYQWILEKGILAQALPCTLHSTKKEQRSFSISGDLLEVTQQFNNDVSGQKKVTPFLNAGVMSRRKVWSLCVKASFKGVYTTLGDVLLDEKDVPESFFVSTEDLPKWEYLKGGKTQQRITKEGYEYKYSEGSMAFPDALDKPSRTIITGEGGISPSRIKHIVQTYSGRYRRLMPLELERLNMFPDNHTEGVSDTKRAFLMGNALVTGIVERIGSVLVDHL